MLSLHGSAHLRELLGDRCPQRHQTGRPNQDDIKAAVIAFQFKMHRTFSTRPIPLTAPFGCAENSTVCRGGAALCSLLVPTAGRQTVNKALAPCGLCFTVCANGKFTLDDPMLVRFGEEPAPKERIL